MTADWLLSAEGCQALSAANRELDLAVNVEAKVAAERAAAAAARPAELRLDVLPAATATATATAADGTAVAPRSFGVNSWSEWLGR